MRIVVTGGKTGGHVFPGLAVVEALRQRWSRPDTFTTPGPEGPRSAGELRRTNEIPQDSLLYIGFAGGIEEAVVPAAGIPLVTLRLTTPDTPLKIARGLADLILGMVSCWRRLRTFRPDVVFSTGGFVSLPAVGAAWVMKVPIAIYLPDVRPGATVRYTSRLATRLAVSVRETRLLLPQPEKVSVTGYPVRGTFLTLDRETARATLGLGPDDLQLVIMGGSLGAATINRSIATGLEQILKIARIVHICGDIHLEEMAPVRDGLSVELRERYQLVSSLPEVAMATTLFASDLAITRGGASILGELPAAGLPAIVIPLPADRVGQAPNAAVLESHGACLIVSNQHAPEELNDTLIALLNDSDRRRAMAQAMSALKRPTAADDIASMIAGLARTSSRAC